MRHEEIDHFRVAREAAGGEHHAVPCADARCFAVDARGYTLHAGALTCVLSYVLTRTQQPLSRRVENDVHAGFTRALLHQRHEILRAQRMCPGC